MKVEVAWKGKMRFEGSNENNALVTVMDSHDPAIEGESGGQTPKEMFLQALAGCSGMDVIHILKRMRAELPDRFVMEVSGPTAEKDPQVFLSLEVTYRVDGPTEESKLLKAVRMSQDTYCSVSAMIRKACPIRYRVISNGRVIHLEDIPAG